MRIILIIFLSALLVGAHRRIDALERQAGTNASGSSVWNAEQRSCLSAKASR